jgi:hypothetical protein
VFVNSPFATLTGPDWRTRSAPLPPLAAPIPPPVAIWPVGQLAQVSVIAPAATDESVRTSDRPLSAPVTPLTVAEVSPVPPLSVLFAALEVFDQPPLTTLSVPLDTFERPPLTVLANAVDELLSPPLTAVA